MRICNSHLSNMDNGKFGLYPLTVGRYNKGSADHVGYFWIQKMPEVGNFWILKLPKIGWMMMIK